MGKKSFYAVARGHVPGIYRTWGECAAQVQGFSGNVFKGFESESEARRYMERHGAGHAARLRSAAVERPSHSTHADRFRPISTQQRQYNGYAPAPRMKSTHADRFGDDLAERPLPVRSSLHSAEQSNAAIAGGFAELGPTVRPGRTARIQFDGASKRNPGPASLGAVVYDDETGAEVGRVRAYMGDYHTNNQAEYAGLIAGLQAAWDMGYTNVDAQGDSTLVVKQVLGQWRVKNEGLMPYHSVAVAMSRKFNKFFARQVPRAQNAVADALGNQAIDEWRQGNGGKVWTLAAARAQLEGAEEATGEQSRKRQRLI